MHDSAERKERPGKGLKSLHTQLKILNNWESRKKVIETVPLNRRGI